MRILFIHPNYRSGGAEIAGNWPPAWVAYLTGALRRAGYDDIHCIDAMTNNISEGDLRQIAPAQMEDWEAGADRVRKAAERREAVRARMKGPAEDRKAVGPPAVAACGGGKFQMPEEAA